jgi:hypothetical protein
MRGDNEVNVKQCKEEETERKLNIWTKKHSKRIEDVVHESNIQISMDNFNILSEISLEILISIYCTRDGNYGAANFKQAMTSEGIPAIAAHKLYNLMQIWRNQSEVEITD